MTVTDAPTSLVHEIPQYQADRPATTIRAFVDTIVVACAAAPGETTLHTQHITPQRADALARAVHPGARLIRHTVSTNLRFMWTRTYTRPSR